MSFSWISAKIWVLESYICAVRVVSCLYGLVKLKYIWQVIKGNVHKYDPHEKNIEKQISYIKVYKKSCYNYGCHMIIRIRTLEEIPSTGGWADTADPPCDLDSSSSSYGSSMIGQLLRNNCVTRLRENGQNI